MNIFGKVVCHLVKNKSPIAKKLVGSLMKFMLTYPLISTREGPTPATQLGKELLLLAEEQNFPLMQEKLQAAIKTYRSDELTNMWKRILHFPLSTSIPPPENRGVRDWGHACVRLGNPGSKDYAISVAPLIRALLQGKISTDVRVFAWETILYSFHLPPLPTGCSYTVVIPFACCEIPPTFLFPVLQLPDFKEMVRQCMYSKGIFNEDLLWDPSQYLDTQHTFDMLQKLEHHYTNEPMICLLHGRPLWMTVPKCMSHECECDDSEDQRTTKLIERVSVVHINGKYCFYAILSPYLKL